MAFRAWPVDADPGGREVPGELRSLVARLAQELRDWRLAHGLGGLLRGLGRLLERGARGLWVRPVDGRRTTPGARRPSGWRPSTAAGAVSVPPRGRSSSSPRAASETWVTGLTYTQTC